jgi:hypothetical protein
MIPDVCWGGQDKGGMLGESPGVSLIKNLYQGLSESSTPVTPTCLPQGQVIIL